MHQSTIIGLAGGCILLIALIVVSPEHAGAFLNLPGLIVVLGGTLAATFVSRPIDEVWLVLRRLPQLFRDEPERTDEDLTQLLRFAEWFRHGNLWAAERELNHIANLFLYAGLRQVIDGGQREDLTKSLQWRMSGLRAREYGQAHILRTMATFAPAFGMLGTLFGLVQMLTGLGASDLGEIGATMSFAMITTLYGLVAANLFFKPLAIKMERRTHQRLLTLNMLMEGVLLAYEKRHPTIIKETLEAFGSHHDGAVLPQAHLTLVKA